MEYEKNRIEPMLGDQKDEMTSRVTHMIPRAFATDNNEFLDEILDVIESYPELLVGLKLKSEIGRNDSAIGEYTGLS